MKTTNKKSKVILFSLLGVAVLSLTGVGVAAWVIAGITPATTGQISVTVGDTTDKRITVENTNLTDGALQFDAQANDTTGPITASSGSKEDLEFAFTFTVSGVSNMGSFTLNYATTGTDNGLDVLKTAVSSNYLVSPISTTGTTSFTLPMTMAVNATVSATATSPAALSSKVTAYDSAANTATISVTCDFGWGSVFGSKNPCLIASDADASTLATYKTGMVALASLNSKKLYVTITPVAA